MGMTVGELKQLLANEPDDREVVVFDDEWAQYRLPVIESENLTFNTHPAQQDWTYGTVLQEFRGDTRTFLVISH